MYCHFMLAGLLIFMYKWSFIRIPHNEYNYIIAIMEVGKV